MRDVGTKESASPRPKRDSFIARSAFEGSFSPPRSHPLHGFASVGNGKASGGRVPVSKPAQAALGTGETAKVLETEAPLWASEPACCPDHARGPHMDLPKWVRSEDAERPYALEEPRFGDLLHQKVGHLSSTPSTASEALSEAADALGKVAWLGEDEMRSRSHTESSTPRSQKASLVAGNVLH